MPLIEKGRVVPHTWRLPGENDTSPGDVVLSLADLLAGPPDQDPPARVGVEIDGDTEAQVLAPWRDRLSLVIVRFAAFTDGRGFSLARNLRKNLGYTDALWARGPLMPDQYGFALQCGFDAVLLDAATLARQGAQAWEKAALSLSLSYQPGTPTDPGRFGQPLSIMALRQAGRFVQAAE
ncbi:MAG: DUF934 domain-containing protein [Alphaproteobacteria bacterium]